MASATPAHLLWTLLRKPPSVQRAELSKARPLGRQCTCSSTPPATRSTTAVPGVKRGLCTPQALPQEAEPGPAHLPATGPLIQAGTVGGEGRVDHPPWASTLRLRRQSSQVCPFCQNLQDSFIVLLL